jgi:hypothetical protein
MTVKNPIKFILVILLLLSAEFTSAQYITIDNSYITAGNDSIELKFQKWDGELYSLYDKTRSIEYIKEKNTNWTLYTLKVNTGAGITYLGGWLSNSFSFDTVRVAGALRLNLHW